MAQVQIMGQSNRWSKKMKKQDKIIEELRTENATLKSNCNIAVQAFSDIQEICNAGINEAMDERVAMRSIVMLSLTAMEWVSHE